MGFAMWVYKTRIVYNVDHMNLNIQEANLQVEYLSVSQLSHKQDFCLE